MDGLCRDCGARAASRRCPACAGPRIVAHAELRALSIAHIDCDAFYAAVEKRDNPDLAAKPVIVGGGRRGVVSTACYIARLYGVGSAMPMFKALAACPDAVVIRPDMERYRRVGAEVRALMRETCGLVQPVSIDEAYMDFEGAEAAGRLAAFARRVEREIGVTVSVGLSHNKLLAKLASDLDKPRGFAVVGRAETLAFLAPLPVRKIPGVGPAFARRLGRDGVRLVGQVRARGEAAMARRYGSAGLRLARHARGDDPRPVAPGGETKSISCETTFDADTADAAALESVLDALSARVAERLRRRGLAGKTVALKLKNSDFRLRTRSATLASATDRAEAIAAAGRRLLRRETDGARYRLIGIGVGKLGGGGAGPPDMLERAAAQQSGGGGYSSAASAPFMAKSP